MAHYVGTDSTMIYYEIQRLLLFDDIDFSNPESLSPYLNWQTKVQLFMLIDYILFINESKALIIAYIEKFFQQSTPGELAQFQSVLIAFLTELLAIRSGLQQSIPNRYIKTRYHKNKLIMLAPRYSQAKIYMLINMVEGSGTPRILRTQLINWVRVWRFTKVPSDASISWFL